jgi:hypothetical protein
MDDFTDDVVDEDELARVRGSDGYEEEMGPSERGMGSGDFEFVCVWVGESTLQCGFQDEVEERVRRELALFGVSPSAT